MSTKNENDGRTYLGIGFESNDAMKSPLKLKEVADLVRMANGSAV